MKVKTLLLATLLWGYMAKAQNLNDIQIMGQWEVISVEIPQKDALPETYKVVEDAFMGALFNFKGNRVFEIEFANIEDDRMKELFFLQGENWIVDGTKIAIGTEANRYTTTHITIQKIDGMYYLLLPMMRLEVVKSSDAMPTKPLISKSKKTDLQTKVSVSKPKNIYREIDESEIIPFSDIQHPPLAPGCKVKWDVEKKKKCTSQFIQKHLQKKFNTSLVGDLGLVGLTKIMITFVIDKNGNPIHVNATGGPEVMNQNAIDVISVLPSLSPGIKDEKPVFVSYQLPIIINVEP